jgi:hypothetical protein
MKIILVTGGRDYQNKDKLYQILDKFKELYNDIYIVEGLCATGADLFAREYREEKNIPGRSYPANWKKYGKAAGMIRNKDMLFDSKPDFVVAFPTGGPGTNGMIKLAQKFFGKKNLKKILIVK